MTGLKDKIDNMTNDDIKRNILSLNENQLKLIRDASYYIGYNQTISLKESLNQIEGKENFITTNEFNLLEKYLNKVVGELDNSVSHMENINEDTDIDDLVKVRGEIIDLLSIVLGYQIELSYVGEMVDEHGIKLLCDKDYKNAKYNSKRVDELIDYIFITLDNAKNDYNKYIHIVSEIVLTLPMRLVKNNYFDIVKKSLIRNFKTSTKLEVESKIEGYKKQFDSSIRDGYGTIFDYFFTEIEKLRKLDLSHKDLEELDEIVKSIMELTKEVNELYNFVFTLGLVMNKIIVINLLKNIPLPEDIIESHGNWQESFQDINKLENFKEEIDKKIEDIQESIIVSLDKFNIFNNEALSREDFNYDELSKDLLHTRKVLTIYNDISLADFHMMIEDGEDLANDEYLEQKCDSLVQYVNRSMVKMNNRDRKIRMRRLLSLVELPFLSIQEFKEYIKYSLDNRVLSDAEINFKIDYILFTLEEISNS